MSATNVLLIFMVLIGTIITLAMVWGLVFMIKYGWLFFVSSMAKNIFGNPREEKPKKSTKGKRS